MTSLVIGQIVVLTCRQTRLYAEVIQVIDTRAMVWLRPLALVTEEDLHPLGCADLTGSPSPTPTATIPDMVWPLEQVQAALDTEVIPLLSTLSAKTLRDTPGTSGLDPDQIRQVLNDFTHQLWADSQSAMVGDRED